MFTLHDILTISQSPEEYLNKKRAESAESFAKIRQGFQKAGEDPAQRDNILRQAEQYMQNLYILPGTDGKPLFAGDPPAWHDRKVADEEYLWQLNRMPEQHPLTAAYLMTGEEKYAEKALGNILNWIKECPIPPLVTEDTNYVRRTFNGLSPWRALEVGIRMFSSWRNAYTRLLHCPLMTPQVHETFVLAMYDHARVLAIASPLIWPKANHNHYIHEVLGLLVLCCLFPEWKEAAAWKEQAIREFLRCVRMQITPEGGQVEGCPGYHNICMSMLYSAAQIMVENDIPLPEEFVRSLNQASAYAAWTMKPTGLVASIGDTAITPYDLPAQAASFRKLFGENGEYEKVLPLVDRSKPESNVPGGIQHFITLGQITARTGWKRDDSYFMLVCNTPVVNGHSHQDPMTFVLTLEGRDVVTDPSYCTYMNGDKRKMYKSPEYHACLTFGGRPPFEYLSTWGFSPQKEGHTKNTYISAHLLAGDASHANYEPNEHRRLCALIDKDTFIVADDVKNETREAVRLYFHMDTVGWKLTETGSASDSVFVHLPSNTAWELADSFKAPRTDMEVPTQRIIVTDENAAEDALYISLFSTCPLIQDFQAERTENGIEISYKKDGAPVRILWKFGESCSLL